MLKIANQEFGPGNPMVVAEVSCNHAGSYERAIALVRAANQAGADAVKFQLYTPGDMTLDSDDPRFVISGGAWDGMKLWDLYAEAMTPQEWFPGLFQEARNLGLIPFSSVFSRDGITVLEALDSPLYKIASAEVPWQQLVGLCVATGKPVVISDGAATPSEIQAVVDGGVSCVLSCVSEYPADPAQYGFGGMHGRMPWGVSDHTMNAVVPAVGAAMGATVIEAHIMMPDKDYETPPLDAGHSYRPKQFADMVKAVRLGAQLRNPKTAKPNRTFVRRRVIVDGANAEYDKAKTKWLRCGEEA